MAAPREVDREGGRGRERLRRREGVAPPLAVRSWSSRPTGRGHYRSARALSWAARAGRNVTVLTVSMTIPSRSCRRRVGPPPNPKHPPTPPPKHTPPQPMRAGTNARARRKRRRRQRTPRPAPAGRRSTLAPVRPTTSTPPRRDDEIAPWSSRHPARVWCLSPASAAPPDLAGLRAARGPFDPPGSVSTWRSLTPPTRRRPASGRRRTGATGGSVEAAATRDCSTSGASATHAAQRSQLPQLGAIYSPIVRYELRGRGRSAVLP